MKGDVRRDTTLPRLRRAASTAWRVSSNDAIGREDAPSTREHSAAAGLQNANDLQSKALRKVTTRREHEY